MGREIGVLEADRAPIDQEQSWMILKRGKGVWKAKWSFKISIANLDHLSAIVSSALSCLEKGTDQILELWKEIACISELLSM